MSQGEECSQEWIFSPLQFQMEMEVAGQRLLLIWIMATLTSAAETQKEKLNPH